MFDEMTASIQEDTIRLLYHVKIEQKVEREQVAKVTGTNKDESATNTPKKRAAAKVYPNDPCPCGSGKKYKKCCGKNSAVGVPQTAEERAFQVDNFCRECSFCIFSSVCRKIHTECIFGWQFPEI